MLPSLIAAALIAFPTNGQKLPFIEQVYLLGAVPKGETNVVVQGKNVSVYRTGGFVTMVALKEGTNVLEVVTQSGERQTVSVTVAPRPPAPSVELAPEGIAEKVWEKLPYAGDRPQPHPAGKAPGEITVVIDAGHGGTDTGAMSPHGYSEKTANLALARQVRRELEALGFRVVMTRDDDSFPALYDRPKVAFAHHADAFISIHYNAPPLDKDPRQMRYHTVYSWNPLGEKLATAIHAAMTTALEGQLAANGPLHANYAVTRNPEIPSCLIEADFITTPEGEEASFNGANRVRVAKAIARGFANWCQEGGKQ